MPDESSTAAAELYHNATGAWSDGKHAYTCCMDGHPPSPKSCDLSKCTSPDAHGRGTDCSATLTWHEPQTCADGYFVVTSSGYEGSFQQLVDAQSDEFFPELPTTIFFNGVAHPGAKIQPHGGHPQRGMPNSNNPMEQEGIKPVATDCGGQPPQVPMGTHIGYRGGPSPWRFNDGLPGCKMSMRLNFGADSHSGDPILFIPFSKPKVPHVPIPFPSEVVPLRLNANAWMPY